MPKVNLIARVLICLLFVIVPLNSLDQWFYDLIFRLRGTQARNTEFILVRVNDAKLYPLLPKDRPEIQENLLFTPRTHALWVPNFYEPLLKKIRAGAPKLIVFTTFFRTYEGMSPLKGGGADSEIIFSSALNEQQQLVPPVQALTHADNFGYSNVFPDSDNVVRKTQLIYSSGTSLALRIYHRLFQQPIKRNLLDPLWIDYRGAQNSYKSVDGWDLFSDLVDPELFKGKIVLVGKEGSPMSNYETPLGPMSALEIQASTIETFLQKREIQILPRYYGWILAGVSVLFSVFIILYFPLTLAWLFLLLLSVLILLVTLFVFSQFKLWWGVANPIFCIFGTHLVMLGYKLNRQEEQQWKIQQESEVLKQLDRFKNNFISLFSHDLKTPISKINAITGRLLASGDSLPNGVRESLTSIRRTNNELARLISDILKVTKMESMSLELNAEVVDLNRLVEQASRRLSFLAEEKEINVVMDLEPLFSMEGDPNLLEEVITNLLENAIKYSPPHSEVVVRTNEDERGVRVSVRDNGPGIAEDEIPRITGKFYRGKETQSESKGSGLGLYLAKYFVELHSGSLEITSQLGKGTTVSFTLPLPS